MITPFIDGIVRELMLLGRIALYLADGLLAGAVWLAGSWLAIPVFGALAFLIAIYGAAWWENAGIANKARKD